MRKRNTRRKTHRNSLPVPVRVRLEHLSCALKGAQGIGVPKPYRRALS
jgi:hypothetical protein